jgi:hypothetical protein
MLVAGAYSIILARQGDRSGMMTATEICILTWAVLAMITVAILLRYPERGR